MREALSTNRNGTIDVFRMIYILAIMTGHSVTVGMKAPFAFDSVGILVEFFLFLTGYFTCQTFEKRAVNSSAVESTEYFIEGLKYTIKKFVVFIPFLTLSLGLSYSIVIASLLQNGGDAAQIIKSLWMMLQEIFLMNYAFAETGFRVGALWYLSSLFFVFPAFAVLCQIRSRTIKLGVASYLMLFYYHDMNVAVTADYPQVLLRSFSGLCAGIVIWHLVRLMNEKAITKVSMKRKCWVFTVCGIMLLATPIILSGFQVMDRRIALICQFAGIVLLMTESSGIKNKSWRWTDYAAKLSMAIFILHWSVGQLISYCAPSIQVGCRLILYYLITFLVAILMVLFIDSWKRWKRFSLLNNSKMEL